MKNLLYTALTLILLNVAMLGQSQVPVMSSLPTAGPVLYLDFDGHTVENTSWNYNGPIYAAGSGMTNENITTVFNRVAEDYRPFNINVTTDSTKYWAASATRRMRVILTVTHQWYGSSAGGVAMVNSFTWGDNTPCWVFTQLLGLTSVKNIAEAVSHEAGHTFGLYHQSTYDANCVKLSDYNTGIGSGEIGWAPIMGVGYYRNFTLWNSGPNSYGCTNIQNDLSVITSGNGVTFRTDDFSGTFNQASAVNFVNNQFTLNGIVTESTDIDMFKFTLATNQRIVLNAIPYNVGTGNSGSNLDMQVSLFNGSRSLLNVFNPGTLLSSFIDTTLAAGTYFIKVEGKGNVYAPSYASLGSYSIQANIGLNVLPLRRLELQGALINDRHRLGWVIDADEQVVEQVMEFSTNGRTFTTLTVPANADRQYLYNPAGDQAVQYRLKVTFDNGKTHYSNIVTLRNIGKDTRPKLLSNLVGTTLNVTSPGTYSYTISDIGGHLISRGQLVNGMNNLSSGQLPAGMYVIRFFDNVNQWTEKFVRQ
jgi:hypothetical protein